VLQPQMCNQLLTFQVPQGILQFHQLNKEIVLGVEPRYRHGRLEIEAEPFLNPDALQLRAALRQVEKQHQVEHDGSGQDRIAAKEVDLDLHGIAEPSKDVDVVPALFVVAARRIVVDAHLVKHVPVELGIQTGLQNVLEHAQFRFFL